MNNQPYFTQSLLPQAELQFRMVRIPAGEFLMGSSDKDPDAFSSEFPQHQVQLDAFWLAEYAVTQELWKAVMGGDPSLFKGDMRPVEQVSWFDAAVFCNALSALTGRSPAYLDTRGKPFGQAGSQWKMPNAGEVRRDPKATGYRLPTEAEWEYAARGTPDEGLRFAGSDLLEQVGWYTDNSGGETRDVGLLLPNTLGLYDMSGNVYEWCADWYGEYKTGAKVNPVGPAKGVYRVMRGGSWGYGPRYCRLAYRYYFRPDYRNYSIGFRLALQVAG